jgi:hypothetical protein
MRRKFKNLPRETGGRSCLFFYLIVYIFNYSFSNLLDVRSFAGAPANASHLQELLQMTEIATLHNVANRQNYLEHVRLIDLLVRWRCSYSEYLFRVLPKE